MSCGIGRWSFRGSDKVQDDFTAWATTTSQQMTEAQREHAAADKENIDKTTKLGMRYGECLQKRVLMEPR